MRFIFVDGYNVINSWENLKREKDITLDSARQKLIDILHNYGAIHQCKILVVFDGYKVTKNLESKDKYNESLTVVFTKSGETADAYIEKEIHNIGRRFEVSVVTSDSLEQQTIFQRGATRISCIEFYNMIFDTEKDIKKTVDNTESRNKETVLDNINEDIIKKLEAIRRS